MTSCLDAPHIRVWGDFFLQYILRTTSNIEKLQCYKSLAMAVFTHIVYLS